MWLLKTLLLSMIYLTSPLLHDFEYDLSHLQVNNREVVTYKLEMEMTQGKVRVKNGFSFGMLYGFEPLSKMVVREGASFGVNGMFYDELGMPLGLIVDEGQPIRIQNIGTPTFLIHEDGTMDIDMVKPTLFATVEGHRTSLYGINDLVPDGRYGLFDAHYGKTTRIRRLSTNYVINKGIITEIFVTDEPVALSLGDYVLSYVGDHQAFQTGDQVQIEFRINDEVSQVWTGFQTGAWLIEEGRIVAKDYEPFIGFSTAPQPRTLIGYKKDGSLVVVVVDGRQEGWSRGLSGIEAAKLMASYGCYEAAYLDGGASSTLVMDGELINRPSGGEERAIAHSLLFYIDRTHLDD